jgi:hypothetical protein
MTLDEQNLYNKISAMKRENELLTVIYEELDELIKNGYSGALAEEAARGLLYAHSEYTKWRNDEVRRR